MQHNIWVHVSAVLAHSDKNSSVSFLAVLLQQQTDGSQSSTGMAVTRFKRPWHCLLSACVCAGAC
jgi:hypothetical protein